MQKGRQDAWEIVNEFTKNQNLVKHMLSVEAAMRTYARKLDQDEEQWATVGLLHDFDWEIHPTLDEHPIKGAEILRERGWDEETIRIVLSHYSSGTGVEREKLIEVLLNEGRPARNGHPKEDLSVDRLHSGHPFQGDLQKTGDSHGGR